VCDSHVSSLLDFKARDHASLHQLQCDLLRNAREHAGVLESSDLHSDAVIAANTEGVLKDEMLGYVTKQSPGKQKKRGEIYSDTFIVASAGVVLTETVSGIVAKQFTAEQERRGDRELDEARTLQQFSY